MDLTLDLQFKQGQAFLSEATEILYGGAAGGGKSHLMRAAGIIWCQAVPGLQVYLFRRTSPDLRSNHMEGPSSFPALLAGWVKERRARINYSTGQIIFSNGSKVHLSYCQYPKDVLSFQGAEIHVLMIDELTQWEKAMYTYLRGRVRLGGLKVPAPYKSVFPRILCGANPGGLGHQWVKAMFVDYAPPMEITRAARKDGGMLRQYIPAKLEDNRILMDNDPDYEDRLHGLGDPNLVRAMRDGDWDIVAGAFFADLFSRDRHVIRTWAPPAHWICFRSFDWGSSAPFSVGFWCISDGTEAPDGRYYPRGALIRFSEWYGCVPGEPNTGLRLTSRDVAEGIKDRERDFTVRVYPGPADPAIFASDDGDSVADKMAAVGVEWEMADNKRVPGWEAMRVALKGTKETEFKPMLYVMEHCTEWIRTVPVLQRDDRNPEDVNTKSEDHAGDETRYAVMFEAPYVPSGRQFWK